METVRRVRAVQLRRSAATGSSAAAREAGIRHAAVAAARRHTDAAAYVGRSVVAMPKTTAAMNWGDPGFRAVDIGRRVTSR